MINVIIDLEFTGLDNSYIKNNEIIQVKMKNKTNGSQILHTFASEKKSDAGAFICHGIDNTNATEKFTKEFFYEMLKIIGVENEFIENGTVRFWGFGVSSDIKMLNKYGVILNIIDIREMLKLSKYEERLAIEGSNLETSYYIVTGKIPKIENHGCLNELALIDELYESIIGVWLNTRLTVMPHGHCAGMPLSEYVSEYRRQADGYRFNNNDMLAESLTDYINLIDGLDEDDDEDDDEFN